MSAFLDRVRNLDVPPSVVGGVPTPDFAPAGGAAPAPSGTNTPQNTPPAALLREETYVNDCRRPSSPVDLDALLGLAPGEVVELFGR